MQTVEIEALPHVRFAHVFHAESYTNSFPIRDDRIEISFVSEGSVNIEIGNMIYTAKKGDIICLLYSPHEIHIRADSYHEHRTVAANLKWSVQENMNGLYLPLVTPAHLNTKGAESIIEQLIRNHHFIKEAPTKCASLFLSLLCEIDARNRSENNFKIPSEMLYARRAKEYVQNHLQSPIMQKEVAEHLSITPEYLCAVFKKVEGISFKKYVNTEKLEAIRIMVEKENLKLYEAAELFGFSDPNYVSRLFKKYYGYCITEKGILR